MTRQPGDAGAPVRLTIDRRGFWKQGKEVMELKISEITVQEGRRDIDWSKVAELAASIKIVGLINPITVRRAKPYAKPCRRGDMYDMSEDEIQEQIENWQDANGMRGYVLIAGAHRYEACKYLGFDEIECVVLDCDELRIELAEIDENLMRNDLEPALRIKAIKRREQILETIGSRAKRGDNQHTAGLSETDRPQTNKSIASSMGMTESTYRKEKQIGNSIDDDVLDTLAGTGTTKTELEKVAKMEPEKQREFAEQRATGEVTDVADYKLQEAQKKHTEQSREATKPNPPKIVIGDGIGWLQKQTQCDLLLTDPPYSTDIDDIEAFANHWLPIALSKVAPTGCAYVFIGAYPNELKAYLNVKIPEHMMLTNVLVWHYKNTLGVTPKEKYNLDWQAILYYRGKEAPPINSPLTSEQRAVQEVNAPDGRFGNRYHTWQKPDELAERFIRHSTADGGIILDPFACTGTFLLAASRLGRIGLGAEINDEHAKIAIERGCIYG